jgi:hypothetical protein
MLAAVVLGALAILAIAMQALSEVELGFATQEIGYQVATLLVSGCAMEPAGWTLATWLASRSVDEVWEEQQEL